MTDRREARRQLGDAAVISEAEAFALLPCRDSTARAWLRSSGLVIEHPQLGRVVIWGDVLAAIRAGKGPDAKPAPRRSRLPRAGILR